MNYSELIRKGTTYILGIQNEDGGMPRGEAFKNESGIWTTSESLEALLLTDAIDLNLTVLDKLFKSVQFLLSKFIDVDDECGYWETADGSGSSTVSTGHTIYALKLFYDNVLTGSTIEKFTCLNGEFSISDIEKRIKTCIEKGIYWLDKNQQVDCGWCDSVKSIEKSSSPLFIYYVLKGYKADGKDASNSTVVRNACAYVRNFIKTIISKNNYSYNQKKALNDNLILENDIANLMYGYMCLVKSKYLTEADREFKNEILKYIKKNWYVIKRLIDSKDYHYKKNPFVHNLPYIALITLVSSEEYQFKNQIIKLIRHFETQQRDRGEWIIKKEKEDGVTTEESTWVTAEVIIAFNEVQKKYVKFTDVISNPKSNKKRFIITTVLTLICILGVGVYFLVGLISKGNYSAGNIISTIVALVGFVSSIISICGAIKK